MNFDKKKSTIQYFISKMVKIDSRFYAFNHKF